MKKGIVLACCAMLLAGQLQSAEALDWNRRIGVDRMIDRTIDNTINRAVNKVEKQEKPDVSFSRICRNRQLKSDRKPMLSRLQLIL